MGVRCGLRGMISAGDVAVGGVAAGGVVGIPVPTSAGTTVCKCGSGPSAWMVGVGGAGAERADGAGGSNVGGAVGASELLRPLLHLAARAFKRVL